MSLNLSLNLTLRPTLDQIARAVLPRVVAGEFFAPCERRTLSAAAEALLEGSPVEITPAEVVRNVEDFLFLGRSRRAWRVRVLTHIVELSPHLCLKSCRFSRLPVEERRRLMREKFAHGRYLWSICAKIRPLVNLGIYGDPRAEAAVGFVPWHERPRYQPAKPKRRAKRQVPVPAHGQLPSRPSREALL